MQETEETPILSLGQEDPLEEGRATHAGILAGESHGQRSPVGLQNAGHDWNNLALADTEGRREELAGNVSVLRVPHPGPH